MKTKFNRKNALAAAIASTIKAAGHKPGQAPGSSIAGVADALEGYTRRDFVKAGAAGALLLSGGMALVGCSDSIEGQSSSGPNTRELEERDLLFDLSGIETQGYELVLVAGSSRMPLAPTPPDILQSLRQKHPILAELPDAKATHWVKAKLPANGLQYCYVQRVHPEGQSQPGTCGTCAAPGRGWDIVLQTMHIPSAALRAAWDQVRGGLGEDEFLPVQGKWQRYGISSDRVGRLRRSGRRRSTQGRE